MFKYIRYRKGNDEGLTFFLTKGVINMIIEVSNCTTMQFIRFVLILFVGYILALIGFVAIVNMIFGKYVCSKIL